MHQIIRRRHLPDTGHTVSGLSTHSGRLERWLGKDALDRVSLAMKDWYGPPIALQGVPGKVFAHRGGDFRGEIRDGFEMSALDRAGDILKRIGRATRIASKRNALQLNAGFASLSDLISEATAANKRYEYPFQKVGPTGVASVTSTLWRLGNSPAAGGAASAAPGGRACTSATTGAFPFTNPASGDTQHFVAGYPLASVSGNTLLLYDRLFDVAKTASSTATESVSGVPSRYQSTTAANADYIGGNFLFVEVAATALGATAHNWTVCTYTDQANAASTLPSLTGNASAIVDRLDHPTNQWYAPLETGDIGIKALTQMQCSASVSGTAQFVIGHPIAWMPCPIANLVCPVDGINTAFNLTRIFDSAALSFLEVIKPSTTATTYTGSFTAVAG
jgi:hypothetical protein